jgi:hypothetical protein
VGAAIATGTGHLPLASSLWFVVSQLNSLSAWLRSRIVRPEAKEVGQKWSCPICGQNYEVYSTLGGAGDERSWL